MSTHRASGSDPPAQALQYRLRGRVGATERTFLLPPGEHRIGSADVNDLILPVPGVSRQHARLSHRLGETEEARLEVRDLGSRNGTLVNGQRATASAVRPGDVLCFGPVELRLEEIDAGDVGLAMVLSSRSSLSPDGRRPHGPAEALPVDETTAYLDGSSAFEPPAPKLVFPRGYVPGRSAAMGHLYGAMEALLGADLPVLIEGETGVGKEPIARTFHLSSRRQGPFVAVNCAAIPGELLEAEMFGIGEGVATGVKKRPGKFRAAEGGTLFLDEIGEMPLELQAKLLRALQGKEIHPLGGRSVPIDVWVLAATNLDLKGRVGKRRFRRDLYYRVAGCVLAVPPLRERKDDIPLLVEHFLHRSARAAGKSILGVTFKALERLTSYAWPGNVRELEHEMRRLAHLCVDGQAIESSLLSRHTRTDAAEAPPPPPEPEAAEISPETEGPEAVEPEMEEASLRLAHHVGETERRVILRALERAGGSQRKASRLLGISRTTLARKIGKLGIST